MAASLFQNLKADEGMWLPYKISASTYQKMQSKGLQIPYDSLFNTSAPSIKDAIVSLNNGSCTGSFISNNGLILTNHHCVIEDVQLHSSITNNYLENGFWASGTIEELPNPGKTAAVLIDVIDVTEKILTQIPSNISEQRRVDLVDSISTEIIKQKEAGSQYSAEITHFYEGNQFIMFISEIFEDVRLVASPPSSIGQFGKDEDNWMWPRHSADFALLRVYCGPDGKPAPYSDKNIPYKPKKILPINIDGVNQDDFTMVMGYPGSTQRFLSSFGIKELKEVINPVIKEVRNIKQTIWENNMNIDPAVKIQYASKFAESSNYWKYSIGQNIAIQSRNMIEKRCNLEQRFNQWLLQHPEKSEEYGKIISSLALIHTLKKSLTKTDIITMETMITGPDLFMLALEALYFKTKLEDPDSDQEMLEMSKKEFSESATEILRDYNSELDKKVFIAMLDYYRKNLSDSLKASDKDLFESKDNNKSSVLANRIYSQSVLTNKTRLDKFISHPDAATLNNDPAIRFVSLIMSNFGSSYFIMQEIDTQIGSLMRRYIRGLMEMDSDREFYPDANSSLRLSYGTVQPYNPHDGVIYKHFTTTLGMVQKKESAPSVYQYPDEFEKLIKDNEFGRYQQPNGQMPVCFISNNDITGGNSGSPVLNGRGELIGLAFDGNWEGMASDLEYMDGLQMCVNVDIRYVLFILDKLAGQKWVIDEINIQGNKI